jgi:hypothetical protein
MNYLRERVAYLKGLVEGMQMSELTNEGKLLRAIIDVMDDIALAIEDLESIQEQQSEQIDELQEDLCEIESIIFDFRTDPEYSNEDDYDIDEHEYLECGLQCDGQCDEECEHEIYMVECPYCFSIIELEKEMFIKGEENVIECPKCHENIDVEWIYDCGD